MDWSCGGGGSGYNCSGTSNSTTFTSSLVTESATSCVETYVHDIRAPWDDYLNISLQQAGTSCDANGGPLEWSNANNTVEQLGFSPNHFALGKSNLFFLESPCV